MRRLPFFLIPCLALASFGFGCKEPTYEANQATNWRGVIQDPSPRPRAITALPPKQTQKLFDTVQPEAPELPLLRQALSNLANAKSFKATLTLPPAEGQTTPTQGQLVFDRAKGFRGTITINPQVKSEVLVVDNQIYFRANTTTWQTITYTPDGDRLQAFFRVAFLDPNRPIKLLVSDSAKVLETKDDPRGCRRYVYTEALPSGDTAKTSLCIQDNFPVSIINEYAEGNTEVTYSDINQPVDIGSLR